MDANKPFSVATFTQNFIDLFKIADQIFPRPLKIN